jgi:methyl-accepting chemotaxis protein
MVTGIQFQDRTRQRLEHVVDTLEVIDQALEEL